MIVDQTSSDDDPRALRVLDFEIREKKKHDRARSAGIPVPDWRWNGFTPDIHNVRGAWQ
ncbi:hypothetical protein [Cryptosporangium phraense]|uniref:hypothetical protein n=1 Tax=Cryptosporangium phraense TaxID=2593070 RepID=UPI0014794712|nr:hypothetical protein [Cryptosporangium phraense]